MIEVEKKFFLSADDEARLLDGATFSKEASITDSYYDDDSYALTLKDWWLRLRDGAFELKVPLRAKGVEQATNQYYELEDEQEIREALGLNGDESLAQAIEQAGYEVFCPCETTRRKYQKDGFAIDLDTVTYGDNSFRYAIAEIELMVESEADVEDATNKIIAFAQAHDLATDTLILGKVGAYIKDVLPSHYGALVQAGILK